MTIDEIITRLEGVSAGSVEFDAVIAGVLRLDPIGFSGSTDAKDRHISYREYTTSVDAALTLIPEGWGAEIFWHDGASAKRAYVDLRLANPRWEDPACPPEEYHQYAALVDSYESTSAEPHPLPQARPLAIAICIAALKARKVAQ